MPQPSTARLDLIASLEPSHFWFVARRALVMRLLGLGRLRPDLVLDVGCGTGSMAAAVATEGVRVIAVDLRREGLERLQGLHRSAWPAVASSTHLPVASRVVDAALALDVLEHTDDLASIREIERVLKPGGLVIITVPALPWLWSARDVEAGHRRRYTRRTLAALLDRAGLEVVELRFYQCLLLPLVIATRLAGKRWRRSQVLEEQPGWLVNGICRSINRFDVAAGDYVRWPWGSSLAALARKPV